MAIRVHAYVTEIERNRNQNLVNHVVDLMDVSGNSIRYLRHLQTFQVALQTIRPGRQSTDSVGVVGCLYSQHHISVPFIQMQHLPEEHFRPP